MWPDFLRRRPLIVAGLAVACLALSTAAGFTLATYQYSKAVGPEYRSWPALLDVERTLLPIAETMLRTREVLKQREADLSQTLETREKDLKDRYAQRAAELKIEAERLEALRKTLEQKEIELGPNGKDELQRRISELKERANTLELALEKERATVKRLTPPTARARDIATHQAALDEAIAKLEKSLEATTEATGRDRRNPIRPRP